MDAAADRAADENANEDADTAEEKPKPAQTPPKPIQRAVTARWLKTSESSRPLRNPNASASLVRPRGAAGSSSQRFIQRVTNQLASLAASTSTAQASPTRYADQLFGTAQPSLDAAPSVNETSYRDDSNVSEARY
ncbi:Voltage-gated Ion Channel (VIC) Superfamily [Phytophthora cinnamomi]|uniref:Voltage-gated Ion Channel (VIC) Superfamily n=1 Tax=Phytophthora cinnamomi TaxID=4785 RepID=UPI0035597BBE|nr:Voltage-gated Ion Channel (VIC) Superfamily [Phytophthora cinnamomi]